MAFGNRRYVIIEATEVADMDFGQLLENSADSLRWSLDETKTFVKYEGAKPRFLYGKTVLSHSQIRAELATSDWNPPAPDPLP